MRLVIRVCPAVLLLACSASLSETTFPTGSQSVVSTADLQGVYVVDQDGGAVSRFDASSGSVSAVSVGDRPERLARVGNRVFVTLRGERAIAELKDEGGVLSVVNKVEVGPEPTGIVAREDGTRLYVALSQGNAVLELDGESLVELRRFEIAGQPRFLALHPGGSALFVGSAMGGRLTRVDLEAGTSTELALPRPVGAGSSGEERFATRITGDMWITADGDTLGVPSLYVDNLTPVEEPDSGVSGGGYASSASIVTSRMNPAVVMVELDAAGEALSSGEAVFLAGSSPIGRGSEIVRSYPSSVTFAPRGDVMVVTMEGSATAIVMSTTTLSSTGEQTDTGFSVGNTPFTAGFSMGAGVFTSMNAGPRGVAFLDDDRALVDNFLDHSLRELDVRSGRSEAAAMLGGSSADLSATMEGGTVHSGITTPLSDELEEGRRMFYSAADSTMAADGAGVSCATCHFDGRNDGLTWTFTDSVRQTPTLAAVVAETAPYTWTGGVDTIAAEALVTSQGRMGGSGLTTEAAMDIQAFIASIPEVDVLNRGATGSEIERGREIFERAEVGCADCHPAPLYTDNALHDTYGLSNVNTPSLRGIAASAPYLHNGSADTLRDVLESARTGEMGNTGSLSESEMDDLEAFVASL